MEYKMFGADRSVNEEFRAELQAFCDLDGSQREALASWFESTADFNPYAPEIPPGIVASTLLPEQFRETVVPIRFILENWHRRSLTLEDIERDLLLLGFDSSQLTNISNFLNRLSGIKERVWLHAAKNRAQLAGLPTIDDANIVWDARPFFGGSSYYYFSNDADNARYQQCLGLTCMAIMEFMVSDSSGTKQRIALQMNEDGFRMILRAANRADEQLKALKDFIKPLATTGKIDTKKTE